MFTGSNDSSFSTTSGIPEMAEPEIARFLSNLAAESRVSGSTQNQALNALLFLYHQVLGKEIGYVNGVVRAKKTPRLPVVLTVGKFKPF